MASKGKKGRSKKRKKKGGRKGSKKRAVEQTPDAVEDSPSVDDSEAELPEPAEAAAVVDEPALDPEHTEEEPEVLSLDDEDDEVEVYSLDEDEEPEVYSLDEEDAEPEVFALDDEEPPEAAEDDETEGDVEVVELLDDEDALDAATLIAQVTGAAEAPEEENGESDEADAEEPADEVADTDDEAEAPESAADGEGDEDEDDGEGQLGPTSTPEARDRIVAAALAHAEMQEARYRVRTEGRTVSRWKGRLALSLFAVAGFLAIFPPDLVVPEPPNTISEAELMRGRRMTLLLQAEQIEVYRVREFRTPAALTDLPIHSEDIRYVRSSNRLYQLVTYTPTGETVLYDSARPSEAFDALTPNWPEDGS